MYMYLYMHVVHVHVHVYDIHCMCLALWNEGSDYLVWSMILFSVKSHSEFENQVNDGEGDREEMIVETVIRDDRIGETGEFKNVSTG